MAGDLERPSSGLASHDFWNALRGLDLTRATSVDAAGTWVLSGRDVAPMRSRCTPEYKPPQSWMGL